MSDLCRVGVAIDAELLEAFDTLIAQRGYANRSEAVRDLIRAELNQTRIESPTQAVVGALAIVYDHNVRLLAERLTQAQHEHHDAIVSTLHVHLDHDHCLEIIVLRGPRAEVQSVSDRLISTKGVLQGKLTLAAMEPQAHEHVHPHPHKH
jgi:CopG family transcriptional regulator, nickel-responsive regulator